MVLSDRDDDDVARLPREEDLELDDELPMAAELLELINEGLEIIAEWPADDDKT